MTAPAETTLQELGRQRPEWEPWLTVVEKVLGAINDPRWEALVPPSAEPRQSKVPLLAGAELVLDLTTLRGWTEEMIRTAGRSGTEKMATLQLAARARLDPLELFQASLCQDGGRLNEIASAIGADTEAFQAVATLIPVPFLYACNRRWAASIPKSWLEGYCPICGAWPAFAEVRGIDRSRYFRCGRCATEWQTRALTCPYCGMTDHNQLVSLIPQKSGPSRAIEACKRCLGHVKIFTTLQASPAARIMLDDLASVELDVAAIKHGYARPQGPGYSLAVAARGQSRNE